MSSPSMILAVWKTYLTQSSITAKLMADVGLNQIDADFSFQQLLIIVVCAHICPKLLFRAPQFFFC